MISVAFHCNMRRFWRRGGFFFCILVITTFCSLFWMVVLLYFIPTLDPFHSRESSERNESTDIQINRYIRRLMRKNNNSLATVLASYHHSNNNIEPQKKITRCYSVKCVYLLLLVAYYVSPSVHLSICQYIRPSVHPSIRPSRFIFLLYDFAVFGLAAPAQMV